jgi:hypothetical protein
MGAFVAQAAAPASTSALPRWGSHHSRSSPGILDVGVVLLTSSESDGIPRAIRNALEAGSGALERASDRVDNPCRVGRLCEELEDAQPPALVDKRLDAEMFESRQHDDRRAPCYGVKPGHKLQALSVGETPVGDDAIGRRDRERAQCSLATRRFGDLEAVSVEEWGHKLKHLGVVLDDKDAARGCG